MVVYTIMQLLSRHDLFVYFHQEKLLIKFQVS
jgi:hypothetical protein